MQQQWFKMPIGSAQNPMLGIIAKKFGAPKSVIISIFTATCEFSSQGVEKSQMAEIISYLIEENEQVISDILAEFDNRGIKYSAENFLSPAAERQKRYRERNENVTRDAGTVTRDVDSDVTRYDREREREREREKERENPLTPMGDGSGSFTPMGVGDGSGFDVRLHLDDADWGDIAFEVSGWDRNFLIEKYNSWVKSSPPKKPKSAFKQWAKNFTKGKRP